MENAAKGEMEPYQSEPLALNCLSYQDPSDAEAAAEVLVWDPPSVVARLQTLSPAWRMDLFHLCRLINGLAPCCCCFCSTPGTLEWGQVRPPRNCLSQEVFQLTPFTFAFYFTYVTLPFQIAAYYMRWNFNVAQGRSRERRRSDTSFPAAVIRRKPRRILQF